MRTRRQDPSAKVEGECRSGLRSRARSPSEVCWYSRSPWGVMQNSDTLLYAVHNSFWTTFGVTLLILKLRYRRAAEGTSPASVSREEHTAGFSRGLLALHMVAFAVMYFGIFYAVQRQRVPSWFAGQRIIGTIVVAMGAVLMVSALAFFRSWRVPAA